MQCNKCGKELEENSKFCDSCGEKVTLEKTEVVEETVTEIPEPESVDEVTPEPVKKETVVPEPVKKEEPVVQEAKPKVVVEPKKNKDVSLTKPIGIFGFIWLFILMAIPLVNVVMVIIWAFSKNVNTNKKNYAWAVIIIFLLMLAGSIFAFIQFSLNFTDIIDYITQFVDGLA
ncbi:MAG: zinc-ribbon domain-containing protein [Clostridia bacterium]|nr:zinc-ribbon domain-containing protein [Clostridia bacterium]